MHQCTCTINGSNRITIDHLKQLDIPSFLPTYSKDFPNESWLHYLSDKATLAFNQEKDNLGYAYNLLKSVAALQL